MSQVFIVALPRRGPLTLSGTPDGENILLDWHGHATAFATRQEAWAAMRRTRAWARRHGSQWAERADYIAVDLP